MKMNEDTDHLNTTEPPEVSEVPEPPEMDPPELTPSQLSYLQIQQEKATQAVSDPDSPYYEADVGKRRVASRKLMRIWEIERGESWASEKRR